MTAFFAAAQDAVTYALGVASSRKTELATYLSGKGATAGSIKICSYESNWHPLFSGYTSADQTGWSANGGVHRAIMRDSRFGNLCTTYYSGLLALGGEHIAFDRIGLAITGYPNGANSWSIQNAETDQPPSYLAIAAVNAAN